MTSATRILEGTKSSIRRGAWIGKQVFWRHAFPQMVNVVYSASYTAIKNNLIPRTSSPYILGHLLQEKSPDGAIINSIVPPQAWAKYAVPKGLPKEGEKVLAIENEPHTVEDFSGEIKSGYGKGTKTLLYSGLAIVKMDGKSRVSKVNYHVHNADRAGLHYDFVAEGVKPGTEQWEVNIPNGPYKGRYAFIKAGGGTIVTRMKDNGLQIAKPAYTLRKEETLVEIDPEKVIVERKIDGSLGNAHITGQRVAFRSHRSGGETYYDRLPAVEFLDNRSPLLVFRLLYPGPELAGTVFQGELAHPDGSARTAGILNSLPANSQAIQFKRGPVRFYVWDILKYKGKDVSSLPYAERRVLYEELVSEIRCVNRAWDVVDKMEPEKESPKEFYDRVTSNPLPWGEGIVVKPRDNSVQKWDKIKMVGFGYFKLIKVLPGDKGKYENSAGRLVVENPSNGARGEVGSLAVPDEFRQWMYNHREDIEGEIVKVRSQEITSRGVPRAGTFYGFHDGDIDLLMAAEAANKNNQEPILGK